MSVQLLLGDVSMSTDLWSSWVEAISKELCRAHVVQSVAEQSISFSS